VIDRLKEKLTRTRQALKDRFEELVQSDRPRDEILDELAETLILADVGIPTTEKIIHRIREQSKKSNGFPVLRDLLEKQVVEILSRASTGKEGMRSPWVIFAVGVNGGGKTTSLAKLACRFKTQGKQILMVAADTFRAAAQEQLQVWGKRLQVPVIHGQYGQDPASVVFDAIRSLKARGADILLVDTAGRVHTNINLMNELEKIKRVASREIEGAPHETLLVLDASIGQNALVQAREFLKFSGLTGIFLTKLDGTAKGGSIISIADELSVPIRYVGIGEGKEDLLPFSPEAFAKALLS